MTDFKFFLLEESKLFYAVLAWPFRFKLRILEFESGKNLIFCSQSHFVRILNLYNIKLELQSFPLFVLASLSSLVCSQPRNPFLPVFLVRPSKYLWIHLARSCLNKCTCKDPQVHHTWLGLINYICKNWLLGWLQTKLDSEARTKSGNDCLG